MVITCKMEHITFFILIYHYIPTSQLLIVNYSKYLLSLFVITCFYCTQKLRLRIVFKHFKFFDSRTLGLRRFAFSLTPLRLQARTLSRLNLNIYHLWLWLRILEWTLFLAFHWSLSCRGDKVLERSLWTVGRCIVPWFGDHGSLVGFFLSLFKYRSRRFVLSTLILWEILLPMRLQIARLLHR